MKYPYCCIIIFTSNLLCNLHKTLLNLQFIKNMYFTLENKVMGSGKQTVFSLPLLKYWRISSLPMSCHQHCHLHQHQQLKLLMFIFYLFIWLASMRLNGWANWQQVSCWTWICPAWTVWFQSDSLWRGYLIRIYTVMNLKPKLNFWWSVVGVSN